jgi:hypothetical protein
MQRCATIASPSSVPLRSVIVAIERAGPGCTISCSSSLMQQGPSTSSAHLGFANTISARLGLVAHKVCLAEDVGLQLDLLEPALDHVADADDADEPTTLGDT